MKRKSRAEITIETHRILVVKRQTGRAQATCPECPTEVATVTPEEATAIARISTRALYRLIEEGAVHCLELSTGTLVCLNSLRAAAAEGQLEPQSNLNEKEQ